jgi:hypothetical protein
MFVRQEDEAMGGGVGDTSFLGGLSMFSDSGVTLCLASLQHFFKSAFFALLVPSIDSLTLNLGKK